MLARDLVGILELTENLRFPQHHGIQTRRHTHQMPGGLPLMVVVGTVQQLLRGHAVKRPQPFEQLALAIGDGDAVELGPVTGGEHRRLSHVGQGPQLRQRGLELCRREGDTLAHVDRSRSMVDTQS